MNGGRVAMLVSRCISAELQWLSFGVPAYYFVAFQALLQCVLQNLDNHREGKADSLR
jgi:hypothetical protein